jgi:hypothetical protein
MDSTARRGIVPTSATAMKYMLKAIFGLLAALLIGSCGAIKKGVAAASERTHTIASNSGLTETPLARLMPAGGLKVVEARSGDLQDMPTGEERAIAYRKQKRAAFWFLSGPVDFQEPPLPEPGSEMDGSLLPPKISSE